MKEKFMQFPAVLRKQILLRLAGAGIGIAMMLIILAYGGTWQFWLPCVAVVLIAVISAGILFDRCLRNRYVVITGVCIEIERTTIRKRIKNVYLQSEDHRIRLVGVKQVRNLTVGDTVDLYVADNTPVYEMDGCKVICNYIALTRGAPAKKEIQIQ